MALTDLLSTTTSQQEKKQGISEERLQAILPALRDYISFWREYPDLFIDFMITGGTREKTADEFHFYFYQRVN